MFTRVDSDVFSWIFIGDREDAKNLSMIRAYNIKYVLNLTPKTGDGGVPNFHHRDPNITYCRIPLQDNASEKLSSHFEDSWQFCEKSRVREDGNLLVHCNRGISRSVAMVCAYLMKYFGVEFNTILQRIQLSRPIARPNDSFMQQLQTFDKELEECGRMTLSPAPNESKSSYLRIHSQSTRKSAFNRTELASLSPSSRTYDETNISADKKQSVQVSDSSLKRNRPMVGPTLPPWLSQKKKSRTDTLNSPQERSSLYNMDTSYLQPGSLNEKNDHHIVPSPPHKPIGPQLPS
ncbi:dual specificity phosphatase, catalytic domain-containing protein [Cardiosporidium cionae]|uniref:protein-tyrosine-phosphatase n=1 Tax=Cardiosporidium cionae TaxID=476202 RepID=A0ABQ7J5Z0_9APIC|nr:dual specificity phosphatase, catalytic domain-containing protein [Cardiosporidium cionae]|eukprot:KAF8819344.1 dual specificity phosphatase, catalytic domain-containing protein [Cardiosporidium cionae]